MNVTIAELESYLLDHYENGGIDERDRKSVV